MQTFILRERPLTDNILMLADEGKVFKGNYIAIIKENTFLNEWSDKERVKKFRKQKMLDNYLTKNYPEFEINY
jgi:hypothetical protein